MSGDRTPALASFAQRVVRGAVGFMAAATVAATAVGFWLSYAGLHAFALRSGLRGAEAWAWPASVDLFILAGELGITISAIRGKRDGLAWGYLLAGFLPSVAFNVLHVALAPPAWGRYAVAAVPPVAAMLALAALMRQVFSLAVEAHLTSTPATAPPPHGESTPEGPRTRAARPRTRRRTRKRPVTEIDAEREFMDELAAGTVPSLRSIRSRMHVGDQRAAALREHMKALTAART